MNKSKLIVIMAILALSVFVFCGCGNEDKTQGTETNAQATTASATKTEAGVAGDNNTSAVESESSENIAVPSQGENDLEIITVPQQSEIPQNNTETAPEQTEAVQEITEAESTTSIQKIELPFVPAG